MHNVDYLSFDFTLIDCVISLKAAKLSVNGPIKQRLTNALWRRSAQMTNGTPKLNPATLGWAKHMDDLTLFGPYSTTEEVKEPNTFKSKGTKSLRLSQLNNCRLRWYRHGNKNIVTI
jgi:hypothetical protein